MNPRLPLLHVPMSHQATTPPLKTDTRTGDPTPTSWAEPTTGKNRTGEYENAIPTNEKGTTENKAFATALEAITKGSGSLIYGIR